MLNSSLPKDFVNGKRLLCPCSSIAFLLRLGAMRMFCLGWIFAGLASGAGAMQLNFDFGKDTPGKMPPGFVSLVTGGGNPAPWTVVVESVPPTLAPLLDSAPVTMTKHSVLSVQSPDMRDDHFPVLLFTNEVFSDFTLTTRFKIVGGIVDPMAGVV